ncbi:MAG: helix-turn-helix transcriptional regulator [Opitutaceae bacterium]|nr:helix-turn-helix transcriptional regulator [Opitutaceae bacterium]
MPLASTLDLIGDRWTLLVIRDLVLGKNHFEEFLHSPENIASNILPDRLKRLIDSTLVKKHLINKMDERLYTNSHQKANYCDL